MASQSIGRSHRSRPGTVTPLAQELIWQGRTQIGDEPGVYGDAYYGGLCTEYPLTIKPFDSASNKTDVTFLLYAEDVRIFAGYPGHAVALDAYEPDPAGDSKWKQIRLAAWLLTENTLQMKIADLKGHTYLSLHVRIDTTVQPGLYNAFVLTRLALRSTTHQASFGFAS